MGKNLGVILMIAGAIALLLIAVLMFGFMRGGETTGSGSLLGFVLFSGAVALPLIGAGAFFFLRGQQTVEKASTREKQRDMLGIIKTRGQVHITDLAIELDADRDEVKAWLHDLVGKGLYSGYINWDDGILYSEQASQLHELSNCRKCEGQLNLAGKGVVVCPFCGTEYFLNN